MIVKVNIVIIVIIVIKVITCDVQEIDEIVSVSWAEYGNSRMLRVKLYAVEIDRQCGSCVVDVKWSCGATIITCYNDVMAVADSLPQTTLK